MKVNHFMFAMFINLVWGFNFLATKFIIDEIPPLFSAALRFVVILIFLFPFLKILPGRMKPLLMTSVVLGIFHFGGFYVGLSMSGDVSVAAVATLLSLPSATILAIIILGEKIGWKRGTGILAAFGGVLVLGYDPRAFSYIDGLVVVGGSALAMGVASIFMRQLQGVPPLVLQAWVALMASPVLLAASFIFENNQFEALTSASWIAFSSLLYSAILSSIVGHGGVYYLLQRYPVTVITPLTLLSQVVAVIASVMLLNEILTSQMVVGSILTFVGVLIISLRNTKVSQSQSRARAKLGSEGS